MLEQRDLDGFVRADGPVEHGVDVASDGVVGRAAVSPTQPVAGPVTEIGRL